MKKQIPKIYEIISIFSTYALWGVGKTRGAEKGGLRG